MTSVQDRLTASDAKSVSPDPAPDHRFGQVETADGATWSKAEPDEGVGPSGQSLLSRPSAPHYRRSLFRR